MSLFRFMLASIALLFALCVSHAQTTVQAEDSAAIRKVLDTQQAAWNRADLPTFLQGYWNSPDLTFSGSNGTVRGYDGLLDRYRKAYPNARAMGQLEFSGLETRFLGPDAALVLGKWHLTRTIGDVGGVFSLVFQRFPQGWRIIHDHTSSQKEASKQGVGCLRPGT